MMQYPVKYEIIVESNYHSLDTNPLWKAILNLESKNQVTILEKIEKERKLIIEIPNQVLNEELHWLCLNSFGLKGSIRVIV